MMREELKRQMSCVSNALTTNTSIFEESLLRQSETIDIGHLDLQCGHCGKQQISKIKRRGPKSKPLPDITDVNYRNQKLKQLLSTLQQICRATNQDLFSVVELWFQKRDGREQFFEFVQNVLHRNQKLQKQLQALIARKKVLTADDIIFVRDRIFLSDCAYFEFYNTMNMNELFPSSTCCANRRSEWNTRVKEHFNIGHLPDGFQCSIEAILEVLIGLARKENDSLPDTIKIKLSIDGRNISFGQVAVSMTPLNIPTFKSQAPSSVFCIAILNGSETADIVQDNIRFLNDEIVMIKECGIHYEGEDFDIAFYWCSDLKSLGTISDLNCNGQFCPFCTLKRENRFERDRSRFTTRQDLKNLLSVESCNHVICILHAKQRIVERLLLLLTHGEQERIDKIVNRIRRLLELNRFNISSKEGKRDSFLTMRIDMLTGSQCDTILKHFLAIIEDMCVDTDTDLLHQMVWKQSSIIHLAYMEATTPELVNYNQSDLVELLNDWADNLHQLYGEKAFSYYVHIIYAHLPQLLANGSLQPFSGQGFEHSHKEHGVAWKRVTSGGGSVSSSRVDTNPIEQLMVWQNRKLLMALDIEDKQWTKVIQSESRRDYLSSFDYHQVHDILPLSPIDHDVHCDDNLEDNSANNEMILGEELQHADITVDGTPLFDILDTDILSSPQDVTVVTEPPSKKQKRSREFVVGERVELILRMSFDEQDGLLSYRDSSDLFIVGHATVLDCGSDGTYEFLYGKYPCDQFISIKLDVKFRRKLKPPFLLIGTLDDYLGRTLIWDRASVGGTL